MSLFFVGLASAGVLIGLLLNIFDTGMLNRPKFNGTLDGDVEQQESLLA